MSSACKSYDSAPYAQDFRTSTSGQRVPIHVQRRQGYDPVGIRQVQK